MKNIFYIIPILFWISCLEQKTEEHSHQHNTESGAPIAFENGSCPFFTKDNNGNVVMSWVMDIDENNHIFCYSTVDENGNFDGSIAIPPSMNVNPHNENIPKIAFKDNGDIIAVWGVKNPNPNNKYSGLINYSSSTDNGKTWSEARNLVNDINSYDQRFFDLEKLPNGNIAIIWLDNRTESDADGMTLYYAESNANNVFENEKAIAENTCECCRTDIMIDSRNNIHLAFRGILGDTVRDMLHCVSEDLGNTFSEPQRISVDNWEIDACPHTGPSMAQSDDKIRFTWFTDAGNQTGIYSTHSSDNGQTFSKRKLIEPNGRHPQMTSMNDGFTATVWDESINDDSIQASKIMLQTSNMCGDYSVQTISDLEHLSMFPVITFSKDNFIYIAWVQYNQTQKPEQEIEMKHGLHHNMPKTDGKRTIFWKRAGS